MFWDRVARVYGVFVRVINRQFTAESYRRFFLDAGYPDVRITLADGRIPCAVAVMRKKGS